MTNSQAIKVGWQEDGDATVLARITARNGSGDPTGISGEGNWLEAADVSTITCAVFDLDSTTPDVAIQTPSVTTAAVIDPVTDGVLWEIDETGYNFRHDLAAANFPTGEHQYRVEYKLTLAGGAVLWAIFEGMAQPVRTS